MTEIDKNIKAILFDLYELHPQLQSHEKELIQLIHELLSSRPDTKLDESFVQELRLKLIKQISETKGMEKLPLTLNPLTRMKKFIYIFGGATASLVVLLILFFAFSPYLPVGVKKTLPMEDFSKVT